MKLVIKNILLILLAVFMLVSGASLIKEFINIHSSKDTNDKFRTLAQVQNIKEDCIQEKQSEVDVDFKRLKKINEDIVAWIYIPNTNINYPVVKGNDNSYYLNHNAERKYDVAGAIFIDCNNDEFVDNNTFIHGHNMWYDTMFTDIEKFKDKDFFLENDEFYLFTVEKKYVCKVISIYTTSFDSEYYNPDYLSEKGYQKYLNKVVANSDFISRNEIDYTKKMITLNTCSHELNGKSSHLRYLLHALLYEMEEK